MQNIGYLLIFFGMISAFFSLFATLFKMEDFYAKQHGSGLNDSFSIPLIILGVSIISSNFLFFLKSIFAIFFFIITSATACHALSSLYYQENNLKQNNEMVKKNGNFE